MENLLNYDAGDVYRFRHEHVAAKIITTENLSHTSAVGVADLDSLPEILTGDAVASELRDGQSTRYVRTQGGLIRVEFRAGARWAGVKGYFAKEDDAKAFSVRIKRFVHPAKTPDDMVAVNFWTWGGDEANRTIRRLNVPTWANVNGNYPEGVRDKLGQVMAISPNDNMSGKLMLWRGAPGTGKTWSLRALCREWRNWCTVHYIVDPDVFFSTAAYMVGVLMTLPNEADVPDDDDEGDDEAPPKTKKVPRWNLVILEDAGELVGADAKARTGQALSKLLNLSDGMLGQGINLMVLITTNDDYDALHPAISRQGRCLSNVSFESFTESEADVWLQAHNCERQHHGGKRTLSDLYAHVTERETIQNKAERKVVGFR